MAKLGTFTVGASSVTMTRGRGKNRTVALEVSFAELEKWAKKNEVDTKRLMTRSFGRACSGLKKKFTQIVTGAGGVNGVPKFKDFEDFTKTLRQVRGTASRPMGGKLAEKSSVVAFKRAGWQVIGWPDRLAEWAVKFQDAVGNDDLNNNRFRHWLHARGVHDIPRVYTRNPRQVIPEPFGRYVEQNLKDWAKSAFYKELARQFARSANK